MERQRVGDALRAVRVCVCVCARAVVERFRRQAETFSNVQTAVIRTTAHSATSATVSAGSWAGTYTTRVVRLRCAAIHLTPQGVPAWVASEDLPGLRRHLTAG